MIIGNKSTAVRRVVDRAAAMVPVPRSPSAWSCKAPSWPASTPEAGDRLGQGRRPIRRFTSSTRTAPSTPSSRAPADVRRALGGRQVHVQAGAGRRRRRRIDHLRPAHSRDLRHARRRFAGSATTRATTSSNNGRGSRTSPGASSPTPRTCAASAPTRMAWNGHGSGDAGHGHSQDVCRAVNLGYRDPRSINVTEYQNRENEGILYVPKAGEMLYRLKGPAGVGARRDAPVEGIGRSVIPGRRRRAAGPTRRRSPSWRRSQTECVRSGPRRSRRRRVDVVAIDVACEALGLHLLLDAGRGQVGDAVGPQHGRCGDQPGQLVAGVQPFRRAGRAGSPAGSRRATDGVITSSG